MNAYIYDGSFEGFLCAIFKAFEEKITPLEIIDNKVPTMFLSEKILTDLEKAERVKIGIAKKIGSQASYNSKLCYLSGEKNKGVIFLKYLRLAFKYGECVDNMLNVVDVKNFLELTSRVGKEKVRFVEILRFKDYDGVLYSTIEPEHNILPLLANHFVTRYPNEKFFIFDKNRKLMLCYDKIKPQIVEVDEFIESQETVVEQHFQKLWKLFFETIEVKPRHNETAQNTHLPKKYRKHMTEFMD